MREKKLSRLVIQDGVLFDGTDSAPRPSERLVVEGEWIVCLGKSCAIPDGARIVDASNLCILPGFIDLHVHFGAPVGGDLQRPLLALIWDYARHRPRHRRAFLDAGVTTIRSVGDVTGVRGDILELRRRAVSPDFQGPRVFTAGPLFTAPGGHPASTIYRHNRFLIDHATRQVGDIAGALAEVTKLLQSAVDGIKIVYDSGGGRYPRLPPVILRAIVDEAHRNGLWTAVHTTSAEDTREAVLAGGDTIEHGATDGTLLDVDTLRIMCARGVTYVPTLVALEAIADLMSKGERPSYLPLEAWQELTRHMDRLGKEPLKAPMANVRAAAAAGVRIGVGTDAQGPHMAFGASLHREQELLVQAGLSPSQVLVATTRHAAEALRKSDLGSIGVGKRADLVLVSGRPWKEIGDTRRVRCVIKGGRIIAAASGRDGVFPSPRSK